MIGWIGAPETGKRWKLEVRHGAGSATGASRFSVRASYTKKPDNLIHFAIAAARPCICQAESARRAGRSPLSGVRSASPRLGRVAACWGPTEGQTARHRREGDWGIFAASVLDRKAWSAIFALIVFGAQRCGGVDVVLNKDI